jgi:hypothetical protein
LGNPGRTAVALPSSWTEKCEHDQAANAGNATHELMAISGHKTLSQVAHDTKEADRKRRANSGTAKRLRGAQNENADVTNLGARLLQTKC